MGMLKQLHDILSSQKIFFTAIFFFYFCGHIITSKEEEAEINSVAAGEERKICCKKLNKIMRKCIFMLLKISIKYIRFWIQRFMTSVTTSRNCLVAQSV